MEPRIGAMLNEQVYEEAGQWFLEFRDGEPDAATRGEFDRWMRRSPDHVVAYLEIAAIWNEGPGLKAEDAKTLIVRAGEDAGIIVPLNQRTQQTAPVTRPSRSGRLLYRNLSVAASTLIVCAAALFWLVQKPTYSTGIGEQRVISLQDGSSIELNSRSKLRALYSQSERGIELIEGQALFNVVRDPVRPFIVKSGNARVRAVGTQFDVYRKPVGTVVTVVEGQVAIGRIQGPPVVLSAGEQAVVTRSMVKKPGSANVSNATAWTQHQLAFDGASLSEVAEEFNRYNERQLVIRDRSLFDFHISGVFSSADPASLIRFLRDRPGVRVVESSSEIRVERTDDEK